MLREGGRLKGAAAAMLASWQARPKDIVESEKAANFLRECEVWETVPNVCESNSR